MKDMHAEICEQSIMGQGQAAEGPAAAMGSESMGVGKASVAVEDAGSGRRGVRVGPGSLRAGVQLRRLRAGQALG